MWMMKMLDIVILTDHSVHSIHNSFYRISSELFQHFGINSVVVISRGDPRNADFFSGSDLECAFGVELSDQLSFADRHILEKGYKISLEKDVFFFLRIPHPVSSYFLMELERQFGKDKIINRPSGILKTGSKSFLTTLDEEYIPKMMLCNSRTDLIIFLLKHSKTVLKPLMNYGGKGIIKVDNHTVITESGEMDLYDFLDQYDSTSPPYLAVEYLENVSNGDKRIVVANGEILTATLRFPSEGGWLCNIAQGGHDKISVATEREKEIVAYLSPLLKTEGVFIYGLDTLENDNGLRVISEINALSPGGITPHENHTGENVTRRLVNLLIEYCR